MGNFHSCPRASSKISVPAGKGQQGGVVVPTVEMGGGVPDKEGFEAAELGSW